MIQKAIKDKAITKIAIANLDCSTAVANELLDMLTGFIKEGLQNLQLSYFNKNIGDLDKSVLDQLALYCFKLT